MPGPRATPPPKPIDWAGPIVAMAAMPMGAAFRPRLLKAVSFFFASACFFGSCFLLAAMPPRSTKPPNAFSMLLRFCGAACCGCCMPIWPAWAFGTPSNAPNSRTRKRSVQEHLRSGKLEPPCGVPEVAATAQSCQGSSAASGQPAAAPAAPAPQASSGWRGRCPRGTGQSPAAEPAAAPVVAPGPDQRPASAAQGLAPLGPSRRRRRSEPAPAAGPEAAAAAQRPAGTCQKHQKPGARQLRAAAAHRTPQTGWQEQCPRPRSPQSLRPSEPARRHRGGRCRQGSRLAPVPQAPPPAALRAGRWR
eukprot:scaffold803_cov310-Pinguiococcus_pyrenoidosus.AAC.92